MHNKTSLILSLFFIFSSSSYSQNYNFSIEAGFGTSHSLNPLTINYDYYLNNNFQLITSIGPLFIGAGARYLNDFRNHKHSLVFGPSFIGEGNDRLALHYQLSWEYEFGASSNWSLEYGVHWTVIAWDRSQVNGPEPGELQTEKPQYGWVPETIFTTYNDFIGIFYLPLPLLNFKYKF